jgi:adenylate cyclase
MMTPDAGQPAKTFDYASAHSHMMDWLATAGARITGPRDLVRQVCEELVGVGVPLAQFNAYVLTLHPDYFGVAHHWEAETGKVRTGVGTHDIWETSAVTHSPLQPLREGAAASRWHIEKLGPPEHFPPVIDYMNQGCTDYCAMKLPFSDQSNQAVTFVTKAPGGFTTDHLRLIDSLLPTLGQLTEVQAVRYLATVLLDTYVGRQTGGEIMAGNILRGHGRTLRAVILMTDLQGFTALSNSLPRDTLIEHLNSYFDAFGQPVEAEGGEILKFIGDAMLAIFPVDDGNGAERCDAALRAVQTGLGNIDQLNQSRGTEDAPLISCGAALHIGDVMYGNIGTAKRLDFTVIGPAVNLVARIEGLTRDLGERVLLSADFAIEVFTPT